MSKRPPSSSDDGRPGDEAAPSSEGGGQSPHGSHRHGLAWRLRNYFIGGILVTAPFGITVWIAWSLISFVDRRVHPLIPPAWDPDSYLPFSVPGLGLLLVIVALTLVGMVTANVVGRLIMRIGERLVERVPVISSIYSATKQVFETILAQRATAFRKVVLIEYPYRGCWGMGFVTTQGRGEVQRVTPDDVVAVFFPAVPNPLTGFLLFLPRSEVHDLDLTVEQGLKLAISGGVVVPSSEDRPSRIEPPLAPVAITKPRLGLFARLRNYFLAGVLVTAPAAITFWLAWRFVTFVDELVTPLIPAMWNPASYLPVGVPGLGLIIAMVGLTLIGMLAAGLLGRWFTRTADWVAGSLPIVRSIYTALKQIVETVLASRSEAFRECVLFQYPRPGSWAIGFKTGRTEGHVQELTDKRVINVFLPTTPNPTSGFLLFVPEDEVIRLSMTIEEGLKMVVSGGIVVPPDRGPPTDAPPATALADASDTVEAGRTGTYPERR